MLGKLLKYETKATARIFLPLYGALVLLAVINRFFMAIRPEGHSNLAFSMTLGTTATVYGILIFAIFILTFFVMIQRFYKNLLGDEGYLMFTLPVQPWKHIVSKMVVSALWMVASVIVTMITVFIMALDWEDLRMFAEIPRALAVLYQQMGVHGFLYILEFCALCAAGLAMGILNIYFSISVGQLFNKHRVLAAFGAFIATDIVTNIITTIGIWLIGHVLDGMPIQMGPVAASHLILCTLILYCLFYGAAYFVGTNYILSRRLNLE